MYVIKLFFPLINFFHINLVIRSANMYLGYYLLFLLHDDIEVSMNYVVFM